MTPKEKAALANMLTAFKRWWSDVPGSIPERTHRDELVDSIEKMQEATEDA